VTADDHRDIRKFARAPVSLEVHYRTRGSFLVSYSLNLSKGGLFLDTPELMPIGSTLTVRFSVPGASQHIETEARVMWVRDEPTEDGLPPGMGLQFDRLEERIGAIIDKLVQDFSGMRLMALAADMPAVERLARYLRSILTCEVVPGLSSAMPEGFEPRLDLILVDLDSSGDDGVRAIETAQRAAPPIPAVALTRTPEGRTAAQQAGAAAVLENPPPYELLRECVLDVLGKPYHAE
jgi:type IV pilus assembly protein PilZ